MTMQSPVCVFPDWVLNLPSMQMQSVLMLAARGPDNVEKFHPVKTIVTRYRATVLKAAYLGRQMEIGESDDTTFMTLIHFEKKYHWEEAICQDFFNNVDCIAHHYYMHLMHGAEIIGYYHPHEIFRERWKYFYFECCSNLHLYPETGVQLTARLNDWDQQHWNDNEL